MLVALEINTALSILKGYVTKMVFEFVIWKSIWFAFRYKAEHNKRIFYSKSERIEFES
jgi:hypothetical protein